METQEQIRKSRTRVDKILTSFSKEGFSMEKVRRGLEFYGIETAEQLATYNQFAFRFGGNTEYRGRDLGDYGKFTKTGYEYLEKCLKAKGMSFAKKPSGNPTPFQVIGGKSMKEYLLKGLDAIKTKPSDRERHYGFRPTGERYYGAEQISNEARNYAWVEDDWDYFDKVFRVGNTQSLLEELANDGKIERVETSAGNFYRTKRTEISETKPEFRKIFDLELSAQAKRALKKLNLKESNNLGDLVHWLSIDEGSVFIHSPEIGKGALAEVKRKLGDFGINLKEFK